MLYLPKYCKYSNEFCQVFPIVTRSCKVKVPTLKANYALILKLLRINLVETKIRLLK